VIVFDAVLLGVREDDPVRVNVLEDVDVMVEERVGMYDLDAVPVPLIVLEAVDDTLGVRVCVAV
jgi:hypothetical protein